MAKVVKSGLRRGDRGSEVRVLRGRGLPVLQGFGRGNQRVLVRVAVPRQLTEEQRRDRVRACYVFGSLADSAAAAVPLVFVQVEEVKGAVEVKIGVWGCYLRWKIS